MATVCFENCFQYICTDSKVPITKNCNKTGQGVCLFRVHGTPSHYYLCMEFKCPYFINKIKQVMDRLR